MINIIKESYLLFFKKFPIWVAFLLPMLIFSFLDDAFLVAEHGVISKIVGIIVFAATELALYRYIMEIKLGGPWKSIYKMVILAVFQVVMGLIMLIPVYIFLQIAQHHNLMSFTYVFCSFLVNVFLGGWLFAKANAVIPLIVAGEKFSFSRFKTFSKDSYLAWAWVSLLIYFPYVACFYLIDSVATSIVITSLYVALFCLFNALYYKNKNK